MVDLGTAPIGRLAAGFMVPSLVGTLANTLYNIVDRIFIGQGVGAMALSGLALTFPIINILTAFGMLVGAGAAALCSIMMGSRNPRLGRLLPNALMLSLGCYAVVTTLLLVFLRPVLTLFGGSEATIPYAVTYLSIIIPGHIFTSTSFALANIIRASGRPALSMFILLFGAVLNTVLDPIFIFGLGLGIQGAAIATLISMAAATAWGIVFFLRPGHEVSLRHADPTPDFRLMLRILSIGLAPFLLQLCNSLVNMFMNRSLAAYGGDLSIGAFGIISSYTALIATTIVGLANGLQPIIGYNYGAGQMTRVRRTLVLGIAIATAITTAGWIAVMAAPEWIARAFNSSSPELERLTVTGLRIFCSMLPLVGFHIVVTNFYQSIGRAHISVLLSLTRQVIFLLPAIALLPRLVTAVPPIDALWMAQPVSTVAAVAVAAIVLVRHNPFRQNNKPIDQCCNQ